MKPLYLLLILLGISFSSLARVDIILVCNKVGETKGIGVVKPTLYNTDVNYFVVSKNKISLLSSRYGDSIMELPFFFYREKGKIEGSGSSGFDKVNLGYDDTDLYINFTRFVKFISTPDNQENKVEKTVKFSECYILDRVVIQEKEELVPFSQNDNSDVGNREGNGTTNSRPSPHGHNEKHR